MNRDRILTWLEGSILGFLLSFGAAACLVSGYAMDAGGHGFATEMPPVELASVALWCGIFSVISSCLFLNKYSAWAVPIGLALCGAFLWFDGELALSAEALVHTVSLTCDAAYGWGIAAWSGEALQNIDRTLAVQAIGVVVAAVSTWVVCRGRRSFWAMGTALLPLLICTLVTDRIPEEKYLFIWLSGIGTLALTQTARRQNERQGNTLTAMISIPLILALMLLFYQVPQTGYQEQYRADAILQQVQNFWNFQGETAPVGAATVQTVDLTLVGMRSEHRSPRMEVVPGSSGVIYLRGEVYDVYTGTDWRTSANTLDLPWQSFLSDYDYTMSIHTRFAEDIYYTPYYTADSRMGPQGFANPQRQTDYSFAYTIDYYFASTPDVIRPMGTASPEAIDKFTNLPESTRQWAEALVARILEGSNGSVPQRIAQYVQNSARYDLNTPRMDNSFDDFALWFLTRSDTGYCVHFATSAVVLLRAANIPARYVTGYMFLGTAGEMAQVTTREAHAWVEYWTQEAGWQILEATPAAQTQDPVTETTEPVTEPEETTTAPATEPEPTSEPATEGTTKPSLTGDSKPAGTEPENMDLSWLWKILLWFLGIGLTLTAVIGQYCLRRNRKYRLRNSGKHNFRAIESYKQLESLCKLTHEAPAESCKNLALKAKFSQHRLDQEELQILEAEVSRQQQLLQSQSWYRQLVFRLIFAAY